MKLLSLYQNRKFLIGLRIIVVILVLYVCYLIYKYLTERNEGFSEDKSEDKNTKIKKVISTFDSGSGFYSNLMFKLNHYIYCKKNNLNFAVDTNNWPYQIDKGWIDYFEDVKLNPLNDTNITDIEIKRMPGCCSTIEEYPLSDYIDVVPEFYKPNKMVLEYINSKYREFNINKGEYGAIYIRRGDKLVDEINFIHSNKFVDLLLEKYPECRVIFIQTDDYNSVIEIKDYLYKTLIRPDIKVITLCPENVFGSIANNYYRDGMLDKKRIKNGKENEQYLEKIKNNLSKNIIDMNIDERRAHTLELLTSVDICCNAKICICDYDSNVSRFIKISHWDHVFDVSGKDSKLSRELIKCPGWNIP